MRSHKNPLFFKTTGLLYCVACLLLLCLSPIGQAEEVSKFYFDGTPQSLSGKNLVLPEKNRPVAMAENVQTLKDSMMKYDTLPVSFFFIIDHSGSMYQKGLPGTPTDQNGNRFVVTRWLLDSIRTNFKDPAVGLAVFRQYHYFYKDDDLMKVFDTVSSPWNEKGCYIRILKLNKSYPPSGKTGYEILKSYLETMESTNSDNSKYVDLKYRPSSSAFFTGNQTSTNINTGFDAARNAFKNPEVDTNKNNHYIVFLSDGEATYPGDGTNPKIPEGLRYMKGDSTPTTFTVYFVIDTLKLPMRLDTMNKNIIKNGYSKSNSLSSLFLYRNKSAEELRDFMIKNIFKIKVSNFVQTPINLRVNTIESNNWTDKNFLFPEPFPLTSRTTHFNYTIKFLSKNANDDTDPGTVKEIAPIDFNVDIQGVNDGTPRISFKKWDRSLQFNYNNSPITVAMNSMQKIKIKFSEKQVGVDPLYPYKPENMVAFVWTEGARDSEDVVLSGGPTEFTGEFNCKYLKDLNPTKNNGTLECKVADRIYATFRNKKLPLDTLVANIPFKSNIIEFSDGYYFDEDGRGNIDSIFLPVVSSENSLNEAYVLALLSKVHLPAFRKILIGSATLVNGGLSIKVSQDTGAPVDMTYTVPDKDIYSVDEGDIGNNLSGFIKGASGLQLLDRMGPIITTASLREYTNKTDNHDSLTVEFSEPTYDVTDQTPFIFVHLDSTGNQTQYLTDLSFMSSSSDHKKMLFQVNKTYTMAGDSFRCRSGDSIWIYWKRLGVKDYKDNYQSKETNKRRVLSVLTIYPLFDLEARAVSPYDLKNPISKAAEVARFQDKLSSSNKAELTLLAGNTKYQGVLINVVPTHHEKYQTKFRLVGQLVIYDAVGNIVFNKRDMNFNEKTKILYYLWNAENERGRLVGQGAYLAVIKAEAYNEQNAFLFSKKFNVVIGIQRLLHSRTGEE